jgi:hypothetical protein
VPETLGATPTTGACSVASEVYGVTRSNSVCRTSRLGFGVATVLPVKCRQIGEAMGNVGMVWAERFVTNRQRAIVERLGFGTEALAPVKLGQIVQDPGNVGMVGAECHFRDRQGPLVKRLGLDIAAFLTVKLGEVVEAIGKINMIGA